MENIKNRKALSFFSLLVTILYPCLFMYFQNVGEGNFIELGEAVVKLGILAGVVFVFTWIVVRNVINAILYSELAMLILMNFNSILNAIKKLIPGMRKAYFFVIVATIGILLLVAMRKKGKEIFEPVAIIGIMFAVLISVNFVTAIPEIATKVSNGKVVVEGTGIADKVFGEERPNVYYLFFDEYAGFECIERYYDYDNAEFAEFLQEEGFNISCTSRNTESMWTSTILPNLLNLSYVASDVEYSIDNFAKTENALMYQLFRNNGYIINMINHTDQLKTEGCNVLNTGRRETLSTYVLENSIWLEIDEVKNWLVKKITGVDNDYGVELKSTLEMMKNCVEQTDKERPTLTISYMCAPHTYFALDENGQRINYEFGSDWGATFAYLGQFKYVTKCIEETIINIKENDPDAVIIIQSDHGARYPLWIKQIYGGPDYDSSVENYYMQNVINCVYYKGETIDIEGLTGINTLRTILNYVFGTNYEMLEAEQMPDPNVGINE